MGGSGGEAPDACASDPCQNDGTCKLSGSSFKCGCVNGYFGALCETSHFEWLREAGADAIGISADGKVVVGALAGPALRDIPARWTHETGFVALESLTEPVDSGYAAATNADGSVVVGQAGLSSGGGAFRWTAAEGVVALGLGPASIATGVSSNGTAIVGSMYGAESVPQRHLFRWTPAGGTQDILSLGLSGVVSGVNADGTAIAGGYVPVVDGPYAPFRWTQNPGLTRLGAPDSDGYAHAISLDGTTIVGALAGKAFSFKNASGFTYMSLNSVTNTGAEAVNGDGTVVCGRSDQGSWLWDATNGTRLLQDVLTSLGVDLSDVSSLFVRTISADGKVLAGSGYRSSVRTAWIARL